MRIAPKPKPGQIIPIEELLGSEVGASEEPSEYTFGPLMLNGASVYLALSTHQRPQTSRNELTKKLVLENSTWRLASADELYALMEHLYLAWPSSWDARTTRGAAYLKKRLLGVEDTLLDTVLNCTVRGESFITHHPDMKIRKVQDISIREVYGDPEKLCRKIFGAQDLESYRLTWKHIIETVPCYSRIAPEPGFPNTEFQMILHGQGIQFHRYLQTKGIGLLVRTTPVTK